MQDRFVGDIGDFGKYALLNALCKGTRLGVVWYLIPDESHNADGKHVRYLNLSDKTLKRLKLPPYKEGEKEKNEREYKACDDDLWNQLRDIVEDDVRNVCEIRTRNILHAPSKPLFYKEKEKIAFKGLSSTEERQECRSKWLEEACQWVADRNVVFLDPDNGLECGSVKPTSIFPSEEGPCSTPLMSHE